MNEGPTCPHGGHTGVMVEGLTVDAVRATTVFHCWCPIHKEAFDHEVRR